MRISTSVIYDRGVASIQAQTSSLLNTQQQIASGKKILTPADDPVAAARVLEVAQSQRINARFQENQGAALDGLRLLDNQLTAVVRVIQSARESVIQGANGSLSDADRTSIVSSLTSQFDALIGLANTRDGSGRYVFSGFKSNTPPFNGSIDNQVIYSGDSGQLEIQISASRQIPATISGESVFMNATDNSGGKTNVFEALSAIVSSMRTKSGPALAADVPPAMGRLDAALDRVLQVQSEIGSRINEVESQKQLSGNLDLQYQEILSSLQDVDYASAVSRLTQQQVFLEAAQKSFLKVSGLSLFNFV